MGTSRDEDLTMSKRDILISDFLRDRGVYNIEDASPEMLDEANEAADKVLGAGNND